MRITRAGLGLIVAVLVCFGTGRILGLPELFVLAAISIAFFAFALLYTTTASLDLEVSRSATPERLRAGTPARIDLGILNNARRRTPVLQASDLINGHPAAVVMLAPILHRQETKIAYRLPTNKRGLLPIGPLHLTIGDPLGLTRSVTAATGVTELVVHPTLIPLDPISSIAGHDPTAEQHHVRSLSTVGDEFFALRPYHPGDELRRVNWRATARLDELVVRQEENPKTGRITVLLDRHRAAFDDQGFERAVSATLSILHSAFRGGDALRFITSANSNGTEIRSRQELDAVDERLATLNRTESASALRSLERLTKVSKGGTLVVITGFVNEQLTAAIDRSRRSFGQVILVVCQKPQSETPQPTIVHDGRANFAQAWSKLVGSAVMTARASQVRP